MNVVSFVRLFQNCIFIFLQMWEFVKWVYCFRCLCLVGLVKCSRCSRFFLAPFYLLPRPSYFVMHVSGSFFLYICCASKDALMHIPFGLWHGNYCRLADCIHHSVLNMFLLLKVNQLPAPSNLFVCYLNSFMICSRLRLLNTLKV